MRAVLTVVLAVGIASSAAGVAAADPVSADGYSIEVVQRVGAIFSGLARDGEDILVSDLGSGGFYRLGPDHELRRFGPTLPHGPDVIGDPTGPYSIAPLGDGYVVAQGWTPVDSDETPNDHALLEIDETSVVRVIHRDFWNPFRFKVAGEDLYVVDSARNSIEKLAKDGAKTTVFTFARLEQTRGALEKLSPTEFAGQSTSQVDAVPTGIAISDGRIYVSLFGGFPFAQGAGQVVSMGLSGEEPEIDVSGLNAPVDLAKVGNSILILEHGIFDQATGFRPGTGRLIAFDNMHGGRNVVLDGLTRPVSLLVTEAGGFVISELGETIYLVKPKPTR